MNSIAAQLEIATDEFDMEAALADLALALPLGRHARLDDDEIEQAAEILEAHRL